MHWRLPVSRGVTYLSIESIDECICERQIVSQVGVEFNGVKASVNLAPERHAQKAAVIKRDLLPADPQLRVFVIQTLAPLHKSLTHLQASWVEDSRAIRHILR